MSNRLTLLIGRNRGKERGKKKRKKRMGKGRKGKKNYSTKAIKYSYKKKSWKLFMQSNEHSP